VESVKGSYIVEQLTKRETEVMKYLTEGYTNKKIAEKMKIKSSTVTTYTINIFRKMQVSNRAQAVAQYFKSL